MIKNEHVWGFFLLFFFLVGLGLNSGPCTCKAGTLSVLSHF
jgi:hypothetical protein